MESTKVVSGGAAQQRERVDALVEALRALLGDEALSTDVEARAQASVDGAPMSPILAARLPVSFGWLSNDFGPSGVIGDPTGATPELGRALFDTAVRRAAEALAEVAVFDPAGL